MRKPRSYERGYVPRNASPVAADVSPWPSRGPPRSHERGYVPRNPSSVAADVSPWPKPFLHPIPAPPESQRRRKHQGEAWGQPKPPSARPRHGTPPTRKEGSVLVFKY